MIKKIVDKEEKNKNGEQDTFRITIGRTAEVAVTAIVESVNDGFEAGRVNRSQAVTWILTKFSERLNADEIRAIRADHMNEVSLLEHYLKQAKDGGQLPSEIRDLMRRMAGFEETPKKNAKSRLTKYIINDDISESGDNAIGT